MAPRNKDPRAIYWPTLDDLGACCLVVCHPRGQRLAALYRCDSGCKRMDQLGFLG